MAEGIRLEDQLRTLNRIGMSLSVERNLENLLATILREARRFTGAEGGTIYGVEGKNLRFLACQNDLLDQTEGAADHTMPDHALIPITERSMAGYVAQHGEPLNIPDVYDIPADVPWHFDPDFDRRHNYRCQSMLLVPMREPDGAVIGVLQLINAKDIKGHVIIFEDRWIELVMSLASQAAVALRNVRLREELKAAYLDTIFRLSVAVEFQDNDTVNHIHRMAHYSSLIGEHMGMDKDRVEILRYAAPMHDVGKIGIARSILQKPGKLTDQEFGQMKEHTLIGKRIFAGASAPVLRLSAAIAETHHEKYDGQGYPHGLQRDAIPMEGHIIALADVFDALSSARCYKPAFAIDRCLEILREQREKHFHPDVLDAFLNCLDDVLVIQENYSQGG